MKDQLLKKEDQSKIISDNIKRIRKNKGLNRYRLAKLAGIARSGMEEIEKRTKSRIPSILTLRRFAEVLDVTIYDLIEDKTKNQSLEKEFQAKIIAANIKRLRESAGWDQRKLAKKADVNHEVVCQTEMEEGRLPTILSIRKIATAFGVTIYDIIDLKEIKCKNKETAKIIRKKIGKGKLCSSPDGVCLMPHFFCKADK